MTSKINYLIDYFKYLDNPLPCLLFKLKFKKEINVKLKKIKIPPMKLTKIESINTLMSILRDVDEFNDDFSEYMENFDSDNEKFKVMNNIEIYNPRLYPLNSIFMEYSTDYYSNFNIDLKGRTVIDIGANSGDSALYFSSNGSKVYGFEPVKEYYHMALKNFELNPRLSKNIKIYNYGVSYKKGKININAMDSVSQYIDDDHYEIDIVSMYDIMNKIEPDILKMDCEGCEFEIIKNCNLSLFNDIIFEYHSKMVGENYDILVNKLKSEGFKIKFSTVFGEKLEDLGIIHAYK